MSATTNSVVVVEAHDAEVRLERRERVVGDLRLGRRDHADQRALADVREADEGDVGHAASARGGASAPRRARPARRTLGARRRLDRNRALPRPPRPPAAASQRSPWFAQVGEHLAVSRSRDDGALGHASPRGRRRVGRAGPCPCRARRCRPAGAGGRGRRAARRRCGRRPARRRRRCRRRRRPGRPWRRGPSRRNDTQPAPPSPAVHVELALVDEPGHGSDATERSSAGRAGVATRLSRLQQRRR